MTKKDFIELIKKKRIEKGLSIKEIADRTGIPEEFLIKLETYGEFEELDYFIDLLNEDKFIEYLYLKDFLKA